jgi:hypothetical protein
MWQHWPDDSVLHSDGMQVYHLINMHYERLRKPVLMENVNTNKIVTWWQICRIPHQNSASVVRTVMFNAEKLYLDYTQNLDNTKATEWPKCSKSNVDHISGKSTMSHVRLDNHEHSTTPLSDLCGARTTYRHLTWPKVGQNAQTNFQFDPTWAKRTWTNI